MNQSYSLIELAEIDVRDRIREDLGDIEALAQSIADNGLMQPLVITHGDEGSKYRYKLVAGGRRYTAMTALKNDAVQRMREAKMDYTPSYMAPCIFFENLPPHQQIKLELEENLRRKDMSWQEKCLGLARYHEVCKRAAIREGDVWTQEETGRLLGVPQSQVSEALRVAKAIRSGNEAVKKAGSMLEAMQILVSKLADDAGAELMRRLQLRRAEQAAEVKAEKTAIVTNETTRLLEAGKKVEEGQPKYTQEEISAMYWEGDALTVLPKIAESGTINHIICDPPYGIDMDNLTMAGVDRIVDTHQVEDNLKLIPAFLETAFNVIAKDGFLCMWYDLDHHEKIISWATKIGWRVQRWPLVWCKTSPCSNSQAQYNVTKATEVCLLMRRSELSILKQKRATNYVLASSVATKMHPFVKPDPVWEYLIDAVSLPEQTVVDPFAGAGSCLAALFRRKRFPIGIEVDPKHIANGVSYIAEQLNKKTVNLTDFNEFANDLAEPAF